MSPFLSSAEAIERVRLHPKMVIAEDYEFSILNGNLCTHHYHNGESLGRTQENRVWLSLRLLHRKRLGTSFSAFCTQEGIHRLIERAFESAESATVDPWFRFPLWRIPKIETQPKELPELPPYFFKPLFQDLLCLPMHLEERYELEERESALFRKSEKRPLKQRQRLHKVQFTLVEKGADEVFRICEGRGNSGADSKRVEWLERLMRKASRLNSPETVTKAPPGSYVVDGSVVAKLIESLEPLLLGEAAVSGKSPFAVDTALFSSAVSLADDGTLAGGLGTADFDAEGVGSQETKLVEQGVLKTFLHNTMSGVRFNRASTGNSICKGFGLSPTVGATNLYLMPSQEKVLDLVSQMGSGIYLESLDRLHFEGDKKGRIVMIGHGWVVDKGDPVRPLCNLVLQVDLLEFFKSITKVANDLDFYGRYGAPSVFIHNLPLSEVCP